MIPWNRRVWKKAPDGSERFYFYGPDGQRLGEDFLDRYDSSGYGYGPYVVQFINTETWVYFGGRLIGENTSGAAVQRARLRAASEGPYGTTASSRIK